MAASGKYVQDGVSAEDADRPLQVCAEAGRKCVRQIFHHPILTDDWLSLVDSLKQLCRLVQLENRMPSNAKVSEVQGRNPETPGTLWDQEAHENAIRILVEEAKINLCLRMLTEFKVWQYQNPGPQLQDAITHCKNTYDVTEAHVGSKIRQFEEYMGQLLLRAFAHVETLQLMDIPMLIEHCGLVLSHELDASLEPWSQEIVALYYVSFLFKHAEALNSAELLAKSRDQRLLPLVINSLVQRPQVLELSLQLRSAVSIGLAALADNEDFQIGWKGFFETPDQMSQFLTLQEFIVAPLIVENPDLKRELRPLLDLFNKVQRSM